MTACPPRGLLLWGGLLSVGQKKKTTGFRLVGFDGGNGPIPRSDESTVTEHRGGRFD
jgi:hypothetical protein